MRIAVTGANGLVGSRLCAVLASRGHEVVGLSRGPRRVEGAFAYHPLELTRREDVLRVLGQVSADVVVHPASMTEVDGCERAPQAAWDTNVEATTSVALAARAAGAHLVYVSTDYVFDGEAGPYAEEALPNPRGAYAVTKLAAELAVRTLAPHWAIARTAVVHGWPHGARHNFGSWLLSSLSQGQPVRLFADQHVSPTLADNLADMLAELAERRLAGLWHTAGADVVDRYTFGQRLCALFGFDSSLLTPIRMAEAALPGPRPKHSGLCTDKARQHLSAAPLPLEAQLHRLHSAWRSRQAA